MMTTKSSVHTSAPEPPSTDEQLASMAAWQGDALNAAGRAGQAYAEGLAAFGQEMAAFVQNRWRHDMELGESLMRCRSWRDAADVQRDWLTEASRDYLEETRKLFELGSSVVRDSWGSLEQGSPAAAKEKSGPAQS